MRFFALRHRLLAASAALAFAGSAAALQVDGMDFPDRLQLAGTPLQLNGVGFRAVASIKGYAAALYLPAPTTSAEQAVSLQGAKRLQVRLLLDVPSAEFAKAFRKGAERNTPPAELPAVQPGIDAFDQQIRGLGNLRKGDVIDLDYLPSEGLVMAVNGKRRGTALAGAPLYAALLRVFIGERVTDQRLKQGLLGGRPAS